VSAPEAPALPDDLEALLRRLRLPHVRAVAPELIATARAQRWEPAEVLKALFSAEVAGRDATRRAAAAFPTGKTFLLEAIGQVALEAGMKVARFSLESLGVLVRRHRGDDSMTKAIARTLRAQIVMVDDIGLLPVGPDAAEGLYRLVDAAYERRSVAVSSNLHPSAFDELMPKTLATATVDRLLHHAHVRDHR
jgi:DNA replication protein DnaC